MRFRLAFFVFGFILFLNVINASSNFGDNLNYLYFYQDVNSSTNKVAYEIGYDENLFSGDIFSLDVNFNGKLINSCENRLTFDKNSIFKKVVCDVNKLGDGVYEFNAKIKREDNILINLKNKETILENIQASSSFIDNVDSTTVLINIEGVGEDLIIESEIPKQVIENLNDNNKDSLISSDLEYEIIKEDPLIAWSVKQAPVKINYTIKKKISDYDKNNFNVNITKKKEFIYFKSLIFGLIFIIVIMTLKPMLFKKK